MGTSKFIITKPKAIAKQFSFEYEIGLSTYDLALISSNKITKKVKSLINDFPESTYFKSKFKSSAL
ncbi:hypothetical protein [Prochlorococcus marinus]|uniref:hypothetical protein n=1 Tax=Prochlorococcus marinus TaxID=1219 RepID=UPI0022B41C75|nr:hypothetical protein [Prochlorococcus marinus]